MLKFSSQMEEKTAQGYRHAGVDILYRVRRNTRRFCSTGRLRGYIIK